MIDQPQARELALGHLAESEREGAVPLALLEDRTLPLSYGWVFFYQSRAWVEHGDVSAIVGGNAPLLVTSQGELYVLGTAHPVEHYLREFERSGNPHAPRPGMPVQVRISGWRAGLKKVSMTKTIRDRTQLGLKEAKTCTNRVLDGESVNVPVADWAAALDLAETLQALGAEARPELAATITPAAERDAEGDVRPGIVPE